MQERESFGIGIPLFMGKSHVFGFFRRLLQAGNIRKKVLSNLTILRKYG